MEVTLDQLLSGKATQIKKNEFLKTRDYVEPFLDIMSKHTNDFRIQVKMPNQITKSENSEINTDDITYNRVWIQAVLSEQYSFDNHTEVVGMVYGLDVKKPLVKFYRGGLNMACTNLCVFDPSYLNIQMIDDSKTGIDYKCVNTLMEQTDTLKAWLNKLHTTEFSLDEHNVNESVGRWITNCWDVAWDKGYGTVKISPSLVLSAAKLLLRTKESPYYVRGQDYTDMFNIYNAFTQIITDDTRDIVNKFEKTYLIKDILSL